MFWPNQEYKRLKPVCLGPWGVPSELGISVGSTAWQRLKTSAIMDNLCNDRWLLHKRLPNGCIMLSTASTSDRDSKPVKFHIRCWPSVRIPASVARCPGWSSALYRSDLTPSQPTHTNSATVHSGNAAVSTSISHEVAASAAAKCNCYNPPSQNVVIGHSCVTKVIVWTWLHWHLSVDEMQQHLWRQAAHCHWPVQKNTTDITTGNENVTVQQCNNNIIIVIITELIIMVYFLLQHECNKKLSPKGQNDGWTTMATVCHLRYLKKAFHTSGTAFSTYTVHTKFGEGILISSRNMAPKLNKCLLVAEFYFQFQFQQVS